MKTKFYFETLIVKWIKWTRMVKKRHKEFIDVVPIISSQNSTWIMGSRIYGGGRIQISLSSPTVIDPLAQDPG